MNAHVQFLKSLYKIEARLNKYVKLNYVSRNCHKFGVPFMVQCILS